MGNVLGGRIRALRKGKGVTQDELGKALGVTSQAVSNWEGGGSPDAEMLPSIADYFCVSIDSLFGKTEEIQNDPGKAIIWDLHNTEREKRFEKAFKYCWCINQGLFNMNPQFINETIKPEAIPVSSEQKFSSILFFEEGVTVTRLNENAHFFFLMPEPKEGKQKYLHKPEEYESLFALLGKPNYMKTLIFMYGRKKLATTEKMLSKHLSLKTNEAKMILEELSSRGFLQSNNIETEQGESGFYICCEFFAEMVSLVPFLYFASNLIEKPFLGFSNTSGTVKSII